MKIKIDFVTNSSSVCFIFESRYPIMRKDIRWKFWRWEHLRSFKTKKQLIAFTQNHACDWINLVRGPSIFYNINETEYNKCLEIINQGKIVVYGKVNQHRDIDSFEESVKIMGATAIYKEWH
jgi:hypothetical protein